METLPWDKIDFQTFLYRGNRVKLGTGSLGDLYEKVDIQSFLFRGEAVYKLELTY